MPTTIDTTPRCKHCSVTNKETGLYGFRAIPPMPVSTSGQYCYKCFVEIEDYQQKLLKEHEYKSRITLDFCIFLQNNFDYVMEQENSYIQYAEMARSAACSMAADITITNELPQMPKVITAYDYMKSPEYVQERTESHKKAEQENILERDMKEWEHNAQRGSSLDLSQSILTTCENCGSTPCKCW